MRETELSIATDATIEARESAYQMRQLRQHDRAHTADALVGLAGNFHFSALWSLFTSMQ